MALGRITKYSEIDFLQTTLFCIPQFLSFHPSANLHQESPTHSDYGTPPIRKGPSHSPLMFTEAHMVLE